jgi:hypothetical protein
MPEHLVVGSPIRGDIAIASGEDFTKIQIRGNHPHDGKRIELKDLVFGGLKKVLNDMDTKTITKRGN